MFVAAEFLLKFPLYLPSIGNTVYWSDFNKLSLGVNTLEATLIKLDDYYPSMINKYIKIAHLIKRIQPYLCISSSFFTVMGIAESLHFVDKRFSIFSLLWKLSNPQNADSEILYKVNAYFGSWAGLGYLAVMSCILSKAANRYFRTEQDAYSLLDSSIPLKRGNSLYFCHPENERVQQVLIVGRLVCNAVTLMFNFTPIGMVSLAIQSYSFVCLAKRQWIKFHAVYHHERPMSNGDQIKEFALNLFMRIYPMALNNDKNCTICQEKEMANGVLMCERHVGHLNCMTSWMNTNLDKMNEGLKNLKFKGLGQLGLYEVDLHKTALPNCVECRGLPSYTVTGEVTLSDQRRCTLKVTLID